MPDTVCSNEMRLENMMSPRSQNHAGAFARAAFQACMFRALWKHMLLDSPPSFVGRICMIRLAHSANPTIREAMSASVIRYESTGLVFTAFAYTSATLLQVVTRFGGSCLPLV